MLKILIFASIVSVALMHATSSYAEEGFREINDHLPQALEAIEKVTVSVWNISGHQPGEVAGATAVLVKIKTDERGRKIGLFLSNAHVMKTCTASSCPSFQVYHHYLYNILSRPIALGNQAWSRGLKIVGIDPEADLAAFTVRLPNNFRGEPAPLRAWTKNDNPRVFALGYPKVDLRWQWGVPKPDFYKRRALWSTGLVGHIYDVQAPTKTVKMLYSSTDLLPGNSGGPLVDINGNLIGINCTILPVQNLNYQGGDMYAHSIAVEVIEQFLRSVHF